MARDLTRRGAAILCSALILCLAAPGRAQQLAKPERYTAIALAPTAGGGPPTPVDIVVTRWSTDVENERVMTGLKELGTKGMLQVLSKLPELGSFATTGASGYPVRYAWKTIGDDGVERITLATDRFVGFGEAEFQGRSMDYPITLITLRIKPGGQGEGEVHVAAQIAYDPSTKALIVENFQLGPVQLKSVKRQR
jgi:hypothetical protein